MKVDGEQLEKNAHAILKAYPDYQYYIGVVKNNAYHHGIKCVNDLIRGGINYLAVSSLEEAIAIRTYNVDIPILCLEPIELDYIYDAINYNVTITVDSLEYLMKLLDCKISYDLKIHLALDTGMHRLGFDKKEDVTKAVLELSHHNHFLLEGIYSHFATSGVMDPYYDAQVATFLSLTEEIDLSKIPIVHMGRSLSLVQHEKLPFCNAIRLGIVLFGFNQSQNQDLSFQGRFRTWKRNRLSKKYGCSKTILSNTLNVKPVMSMYSTIMSAREVYEGDVVGYGATYHVKESGYIYTLPVGYADGVTKEYEYVIIKGNKCKIVSDCMDMILVFSQNKYKVGEKVEIFGQKRTIKEVTKSLGMNAYHLFNQISSRVVRVHINQEEEVEITY